jgi:hypothetical protein
MPPDFHPSTKGFSARLQAALEWLLLAAYFSLLAFGIVKYVLLPSVLIGYAQLFKSG